MTCALGSFFLLFTTWAMGMEAYDAFSHDGGGLTGYAVSHRGALCIVTPILPDQELKGGAFTLPSGQKYPVAKATAFVQPATSIHIYPKVDFPKALPYAPDFKLKAKDRLVVVSPDGKKVEGAFYYHPANCEDYSSFFGPVNLTIFTDTPDMDAAVKPGYPVYVKDTGKLVGTVVVRHSVIKPYNPVNIPGQINFEPLCLPTGEKKNPELREAYGGVVCRRPVDKGIFRWLLPACLWDLEVGITKEELAAKRPNLDGSRENFKEDTPFTLRFDTPVCREVQYIGGSNKDNRDRIVEIKLEGDAKIHLGEFPAALRMVSALVEAFGEPSLLKAPQDAASPGGKQFVAHWLSGDRSLTLQMDRYSTEVRTQITISGTKISTALESVKKNHPLAKGSQGAVDAYKKWIQKLENK